MSLNGCAWLDRAAWALRLELHIAAACRSEEKVKKLVFLTLVFQTNVIAELFSRFGSFIFGCLCRSLLWQRWWRCLGVDSEAMGVVVGRILR